jgi:hypothetical protein
MSNVYKTGKFGFTLYCCGLVPDDDPLWIETCWNFQCDITLQISNVQYRSFSWLNVTKYCSEILELYSNVHGVHPRRLVYFYFRILHII